MAAKAIHFDGNTQYGYCSLPADFSDYTKNFFIDFWFKLDTSQPALSTRNQLCIFEDAQGGAAGEQMIMGYDGTNVGFWLFNAWYGDTAITKDVWYHCVYAYKFEESTYKRNIWINGVNVLADHTGQGQFDYAAYFYLGEGYSGWSKAAVAFDEMHMFTNLVCTQTHVDALYNSGNGVKTLPAGDLTTANVDFYNFDDNANDSVGSNNFTLSGSPTYTDPKVLDATFDGLTVTYIGGAASGMSVFTGGATPPAASPLDIAGCKLWLSADALTLSNNDLVELWTDKSPAANNCTASGATRPTFKTNILNGKPAVQFSGGPYLESSTGMGITGTNARTLFFVAYNINGWVMASIGKSSNAWSPTLSNLYMWGYDPSYSAQWTGSQNKVFSQTYASGLLNNWENGVAKVENQDIGTTFNTQNDGYFVGDWFAHSRPMNGNLFEVLIYDSVLSTANRQFVETFLMTKYGLT